jgi:hypothetical protein
MPLLKSCEFPASKTHNPGETEPKKKISHQDTKAQRYTKGFYSKKVFSLSSLVSWGLGGNVLPENGRI